MGGGRNVLLYKARISHGTRGYAWRPPSRRMGRSRGGHWEGIDMHWRGHGIDMRLASREYGREYGVSMGGNMG